MRSNTEETLQAATTFIIYHENKDTRLQIISCKTAGNFIKNNFIKNGW